MMTFKETLEHVKTHHETRPICLTIGDKTFEGVEFSDSDEHYNGWLLVKASPKDVNFLDNDFVGKKWDIYGETRGRNFRFMGKSHKFKRSEVEWSDKEWKKYKNKNPEFQLSYL